MPARERESKSRTGADLARLVAGDAKVDNSGTGCLRSSCQHCPVGITDLAWRKLLRAGLHELVARRQNAYAWPTTHLQGSGPALKAAAGWCGKQKCPWW